MENEMLSILEGNKTNLSSRQFVGRDLPHPLLLGQEEKQPCFTRDVEDPRQRPSGMTTYFYNDYRGFTLIELLVVVLIIGILAAVALPQYQKAVEKARMTEAIMLVRAIANANQAYHMASGEWAEHDQIDLLDVEVPGEDYDFEGRGIRKQTKYFVYSPNGYGDNFIALAQRLPVGAAYFIYIPRAEPERIRCTVYTSTAVQRKLCEQLDANGTL